MSEPNGSRPKFSVKFCVDVALAQSFETLCPWCKEVLEPGQPRILEHWTPRKMLRNPSNADKLSNMRYLHSDCAKEKTIGHRGTSNKGSVAGGDLHKVAKAKRLEKDRLARALHHNLGNRVVIGPVTVIREFRDGIMRETHAPGYSRAFRDKPKLQGRGFDKKLSKGFDGKIRKRKERRPK